MKYISYLLIISILCTSCMSPRPIILSPENLHQQIKEGELIKKGDKVIVETTDGKQYVFYVTAVTEKNLQGENINIAITEIVTIEKYTINVGETTIAGLYAGMVIIAILLASFMAPPPG